MEPYDNVQTALGAALRQLGNEASVYIMPVGGSTLPVKIESHDIPLQEKYKCQAICLTFIFREIFSAIVRLKVLEDGLEPACVHTYPKKAMNFGETDELSQKKTDEFFQDILFASRGHLEREGWINSSL